MDTTSSNSTVEDNQPFVIEACGDSMWDEVLAQPDCAPVLRPQVPSFTHGSALRKDQVAEDTWNTKDPKKS